MRAYDHTSEPIAVHALDWDPLDGGFVQVSNYFVRWWWPVLGNHAANLYVQLMAYSRPDAPASWPSLRTLASTLGIDRRSLRGRTANGRYYPGAIETLEEAGLLVVMLSIDGGPRWRFYVKRRPPLLSPAQLERLPANLRRAHDAWCSTHVPGWGINLDDDDGEAGYGAPATTPVAPATGPVAPAPQTEPTTLPTQQQGRDEPETMRGNCSYTQIPLAPTRAARHSVLTMWEDIRHKLGPAWSQQAQAATEHMQPIDYDGAVLTIRVANDRQRDVITTSYAGELDAIRAAWSPPLQSIALVTAAELRAAGTSS